jgi:hypothetical protein
VSYKTNAAAKNVKKQVTISALIDFINKLCGVLLGIGDFGVPLFVATFH